MTTEIVAALRAPSFQQDSQWHHPKAIYATKPRDLLDDAARRIEALEEALRSAAAQFDRYAELHKAKGTADGDAKAVTNAAYAWECRSALAG